MTSRNAKRNALSDVELEHRLGRARLAELSLAQFGGVMMTEDVFSGRRTIDLMFRRESDQKLPFSGWVFFPARSPRRHQPMNEDSGSTIAWQFCESHLRWPPILTCRQIRS